MDMKYHTNNSRNRSGIVGVHLGYTKKENRLYYAWIASFMNENGEQRHKHFAINTYGWSQAFRMAVKCRCRFIGKYMPRNLAVPPIPKYIKAFLIESA